MQKIHDLAEDKKREADKKLNRYKQSYKNILWIDDRDDNQASGELSEEAAGLNWMRNWLTDEEMSAQIEQVGLFKDAVKRITCDASRYDLVIFDINLKNGFEDHISDEEKEQLEKTFESYHILFNYNDTEKSLAGYLLYRLLLAVGYPLKRMLIFSGHESKEAAQNALNGILFNKKNFLPKEKGKINTEKYFDKEKYNYYRIRRLVFQACSYWISKLENEMNEAKNIPFNKLYYSYDGSSVLKDAVSAGAFKDMLEYVKMLFPVAEPQSPEKIYYKAMQTVSAFHEQSARIQVFDRHSRLKQYHSCIRNFRNWSSHNLLSSELDGERFALLFCIALRTYFDWDSERSLLKEDDLTEYEKMYDLNSRETVDERQLGDKLLDLWNYIHKKLEALGEIAYYADLGSAVRLLGKLGYKPMDSFLFIPVCCPPKLISSPEEQDGNIRFKLKPEPINELCLKSKKSSTDGFFIKCCYKWIK